MVVPVSVGVAVWWGLGDRSPDGNFPLLSLGDLYLLGQVVCDDGLDLDRDDYLYLVDLVAAGAAVLLLPDQIFAVDGFANYSVMFPVPGHSLKHDLALPDISRRHSVLVLLMHVALLVHMLQHRQVLRHLNNHIMQYRDRVWLVRADSAVCTAMWLSARFAATGGWGRAAVLSHMVLRRVYEIDGLGRNRCLESGAADAAAGLDQEGRYRSCDELYRVN